MTRFMVPLAVEVEADKASDIDDDAMARWLMGLWLESDKSPCVVIGVQSSGPAELNDVAAPMMRVSIGGGDCIHVIIDGQTVSVTHTVDADMNHAVQLGGVDCDLHGEQPGLYYPEPRGEVA